MLIDKESKIYGCTGLESSCCKSSDILAGLEKGASFRFKMVSLNDNFTSYL